MLLKEFVDEYGLKVDEKYQEAFDEIIANGAAATGKSQVDEAIEGLMASVVFEKQNDGYGLITYVAVVENTTGVDFENVGMTWACTMPTASVRRMPTLGPLRGSRERRSGSRRHPLSMRQRRGSRLTTTTWWIKPSWE